MRRTKEESQQTRLKILESAASLFSKNGYFNTSLDEIASHAGLTRGAIYWHFKNKVEIFDELHEMIWLPISEMILERADNQSSDPLENIKRLTIDLMTNLKNNKRDQQVLALFMLRSNYVGELEQLKEKHREKHDQNHANFAAMFAKSQAEGKLRKNLDPVFVDRALSCLIKGMITEFLNDPENFPIEKNAPHILDLFFDSIRN